MFTSGIVVGEAEDGLEVTNILLQGVLELGLNCVPLAISKLNMKWLRHLRAATRMLIIDLDQDDVRQSIDQGIIDAIGERKRYRYSEHFCK